MHLILTGATGLVGSAVLSQMIAMDAVTKITILSRREVAQASDFPLKTTVVIHKDFESYPPDLLEQLKDADGCVWALGISQTKVSKPEYIKITKTYPLAAAAAFSTLHPSSPFTFVYVSGEGATTTPGLLTQFFGRIKGETEAALLALHKSIPGGNFRPYSVRPGGVDPTAHPEILKYLPPLAFWERPMHGAIRTAYKSMHSPTRDLGRVLVELAMSKGEKLEGTGVDGEGRTLANVGIRRLAGLDRGSGKSEL